MFCSIHENLKVESICIKPDCDQDRFSCPKCSKLALHRDHLSYLQNFDNIGQCLDQMFAPKITAFKRLLVLDQHKMVQQTKSILFDLQKEINHKLFSLDHMIELYPERIQETIKYITKEKELFLVIEDLLSGKRKLQSLTSSQLTALFHIMELGVEQTFEQLTFKMKKNTEFFLDELRDLKQMMKPFLTYQIKSLNDDEVKLEVNDDSLISKIKNVFNSLGRSSSRQQSRKSSTSSIDMLTNEPESLLHTIKGHFSTVYSCIQLTDDSIVTSSFDGTLKIWNGDDYHLEFSSQPLETAYNDSLEILNHGLDKNLMMIAASNRDKTIKLFIKKENESWNFFKELPQVKDGSPFQLCYDSKYNHLLYNTYRNGKAIQMYDMSTFKFSKKFAHKFVQDHKGSSIALLPSNQKFVTSDDMGFIYKWSYTSPAPLAKIQGHENCINKIEVLWDYRVATCCQDGYLKLWSSGFQTEKPSFVYKHKFPIWTICGLKKNLVFGDVEGMITTATLDPFTIQKSVKGHSGGICFIKLGFDGRYLSSGEDFKAKIWIY